MDVVTDHKILSISLPLRFSLISEYLCQFNLVIRFRPGKLGAKPDALTRRWDVYPKEGDKGFTRVNPQNLQPVFTAEQLSDSLCTTYLETPVL